MLIKEVRARAIRDSRGQKTIEVSVNNGPVASSPSGKSTGAFETPSYHESLEWNVRFLNEWKKWIDVNSFDELERVESFLVEKCDLKNAKSFGANALYAFESAILKALAREQKKELWELINPHAKKFPRPVGNAIGGGLHSEKLGAHPVFQEFLIIPKEKRFRDNVNVMKQIYTELGKKLRAKKTNDEGAWHAALDNEAVLKLLSDYTNDVDIGIDIASSSFYEKRLYDYGTTNRTREAHKEHIIGLIKNYDVWYVEDPMEENDFESFAAIRKSDREALVVGDDLTATQFDRVEKAIKSRSIGGMIVKPNQNGSLLEVKRIVDLCKKHKITTVMSHRSGETMDDALADYAFAFGCDLIKCGIATLWREVKLKRMVEMEKLL